ncbi:16S rRNA (guanine(527)-N(7))-methyltransferase RsmG [Mesoplasma syrphidae]|uniref:Ribosomal RNA small subunit methyltransferase G n=1 Tax=Mesoplasma syrphidae TaxID=225999 RepID=A0A2K9BY18_9MOLU|nr:16S rRNA (guanine(527)-N(7))-methyltransferase RsmG [Mesoplasma syrphidae]AUF83258.1 16S rRNA (guanine(527)-N(7))-methyltransferase RsmG [Mesoplasma syrphidae]
MFTNWKIFENYNNICVTSTVKQQLNKYYEFLVKENSKYNLTRITNINEVFEKHFLDSLLFTENYPISNQKIADIGTGPGFPGVVIKIFFPETKITLIESNNKKVNFLKQLINELNLTDIEITNERAEKFSLNNIEKYDLVISRAVAYLDILLEIGVQMIKVNGHFIALKGPRAEEEINNLKGKDERIKLKLVDKQILKDVGFGTRINLFYLKTDTTNKMYPRKYSQIKKESQ